METNFRDRQERGYRIMRMTKDITMSLLLLAMSAAMFFAAQLKLEQIASLDITFRYMFGGICFLYGAFRLYRGIKSDY